MRILRLLLLAAGGLAVLLGVAVAVVFTSTFQTWAVRRVLAAQPGMGLSIGRVSAGLNHLTLENLRVGQPGMTVSVSALEVELPVLTAGFRRKLAVAKLEGRGIVVDFSGAAGNPARTPAPLAEDPNQARAVAVAGVGGAVLPVAASPAVLAFAGIFAPLTLPCDLSLEGVNLAGEVILPESRGRVKLTATGGGFQAGREGRLGIVAAATLADPRVATVGLHATLAGTMDTARSFGQLTLKFDTNAQGTQFPAGVGLSGELMAARVVNGESYAAQIATPGGEILRLRADFPRSPARLSGTWKVNMRDADIAPFALGIPLPAFAVSGAGDFDGDAACVAFHAEGRLAVTADRLEVLRPELAVVGEIRVEADFDLAARGGVIAVQRLVATVAATRPVATVRALQAFAFNPATGELKATDPARDLVGISLLGVPVAWARPFLRPLEVAGEGVRGEFVGLARGGGLGLRSTAPVAINGLSVSRGAQRLLERLDVAFGTTLDYNPKGWQAEIDGFTLRSGGATLLTLEAKAGRLASKDEPLKTTGKVLAKLPAVLAQPLATGWVALTGGDLAMTLAASLGPRRELHALLEFRNLETMVETKPTKLPALTADIRADVATDGKVAFNVPITLELGDRKSDLAITGSLVPGQQPLGTIVARIASNRLVVDDARALAAVVSVVDQPRASESGAPPRPAAAPPWAGLDGTVTLLLQQVEYGETFRASNVSGRIDLEAGKVKLDGVQAGLGDGGRANLNGVLTFEAARPQPYALVAEVAVRDFDPGPFFQAVNRGQSAMVEGRFDVSSKLTSAATSLDSLAAEAGGEFQLTSKGGVFRGLPASVSQVAASTGRVAGLFAAAGNAVGGLTGKKDPAAVTSKAQAVAELASGLNPIPFDQLSVVLARHDPRTITLSDFALIAPELRLTGGGTMQHQRGTSLLQDALTMEFKLRARGRQKELLQYLGALEAPLDDLGYAGCTVPIRIGGSIGRPDASDFSAKLAALAAEKAGVTDKATELFNKLIGGGK